MPKALSLDEFINFNTILFADFGPNPGKREINFINSSISFIFCIKLNWPLKTWNAKTASGFRNFFGSF